MPFHILTCTLGKFKWHVVPLLTLVAAAARGFTVSEGYVQCPQDPIVLCFTTGRWSALRVLMVRTKQLAQLCSWHSIRGCCSSFSLAKMVIASEVGQTEQKQRVDSIFLTKSPRSAPVALPHVGAWRICGRGLLWLRTPSQWPISAPPPCELSLWPVTGLFLSLLATWGRLPVTHKAWRRHQVLSQTFVHWAPQPGRRFRLMRQQRRKWGVLTRFCSCPG